MSKKLSTTVVEWESLKKLESASSRAAASRALSVGSGRIPCLVFTNEMDTWRGLAHGLFMRLLLDVVDGRLSGLPQAINMLKSTPIALMHPSPCFFMYSPKLEQAIFGSELFETFHLICFIPKIQKYFLATIVGVRSDSFG